MALDIFRNWMEIFFVIILVIGIIAAIIVPSNFVSYLTITVSGIAAGKIIYDRKNKVRFPYILIITGFIIGYVMGTYNASRQLILILFVLGALISYHVHEKELLHY